MLLRPTKRVFHVSALLISVFYAALALASRSEGDPPLTVFAGICTGIFLLSLLASWVVYQRPGLIAAAGLWFWFVLVRLLGVWGEPLYEDDFYRYLWDARETVTAGSPYLRSPADAFETEEDPQWNDVLDNINNPELPTIYGPVNQYLFALAYLVRPAEIDVIKILLVAVDLALLFVLLRLAAPWAAVLYGFSPLVIKEIAFTGHPDVLSVFFLMLAVWCWRRQRMLFTATALGFAFSAKIFALLAVPLLLRFHWRGWLAFVAVVSALHLPLINFDGMSEALAAMAGDWYFNAPIYYLALVLGANLTLVKFALLAMLGVCCVGYFFSSQYWVNHQVPRLDILFMLMLLAAPAFNPWYYLFVLGFAVIYPSLWSWTGSLSLLFAYAIGLNLNDPTLGPYDQPTWGLLAEFLPLLVAALATYWLRRYQSATEQGITRSS